MAQVVEQLTAVIGADITGLMAGLNAAKGALAGFAALGAASLGFGAAVKTAAEFDKNLKNIQATAGLSNAQMDTMNKQLLEMGKNSTYGPNRVAEAMYDVVGGVQDSSKWMAILQQSLATAEAGQADLKATTQGLIFIMNSYNLAAKDATMVSDVFTRTVGVGVGTMDQFVAAMSPIAITAKTLKVDFKDLGAMTAYLTTKGNSASESATQLQSVMSALLKPTKEMKGALKALGFSSGSAMLKSLGFMGTLKALRKHVGGNTDALAKMFGRVEGFKGVLSLTNGEFDKFNKNFQSGVAGATAKAQAIQLESFDAKLKKLQASLETLAIQVGQVLLPPLTKLITLITDGVNALSQMNPQLIPIIAGVLAIGAGITLLLPIITALGAVVGVLAGPIGLVIAGVAALAAAFQTNFMGIRDAVQPIIDSAVQLFGRLRDAIAGIWGGDTALSTKLSLTLNTLKIWFTDLGSKIANWVADTAPKVIKAFQDLLGKVGEWLSAGGMGKLAEGLAGLFSGIVTWITTTAVPSVVGAFRTLWDGVVSFFQSEGVQKFITGLGDWLKQTYTWFTDTAMPQIVDGMVAGILKFFKWLAGDGSRQFQVSVRNWFTEAINWVGTVAIPALIKLINDFIAEIMKLGNKITDALSNSIKKGLGMPTDSKVGPSTPKERAGSNILSAIMGIFAPGAAAAGARAGGGSVSRGGAYMVGERGPELFTPNRSGTIVPNGGMAMAGAYNGPSTLEVVFRAEDFEKHIYVNVAGAIRNAR